MQNAPVILQVSAGARKYANHTYLMKLVEAAVEDTDLPIVPASGSRRQTLRPARAASTAASPPS